VALARVPLNVEPCPRWRVRIDDLRVLRLQRDVTGEAVGAVLGLTQSAWSRYERGERGEYVVVDPAQFLGLLDLLDARPSGASRRTIAAAA